MKVNKKQNIKSKKGALNEHDTFVRNIFRRKPWAIELLKQAFSPEVFKMMDFSTMECTAGESFTYEQSKRDVDLFYKLNLENEKTKTFVIVEHTSKPKEEQLINIDEKKDAVKRVHGRNIVLFSLLLYQSATPWPHPTRMADYLTLPRKEREIIQTESFAWGVTPFDLGGIQLEELDTCLTMYVIWYTLKYIRTPEFVENIHLVAEWLEHSDRYVVRCIRNYIVTYLGRAGHDLDELLERIENTKLGETTMGIVQILREQYRKKGMEEGIEEGIEQGIERGVEQELITIRNLVKNGVTLEVIIKSTTLSLERLRKEGILAS